MGNKVIIETELDTKDFERQIEHLTRHLEYLEDDYRHFSELEPFDGQEKMLKRLSSEIVTTKKKLENLRKEQEKINQSGFAGFSQALSNVVGKITRWGLALFGVRSAYNFIRQSISILAGENEQLATDIEYIRYAIASTLQPVIERIIQLVYQLLSLINSIAYSWFGINLFAKANAKAMNKAVGSAKQLKKQLAGFDEMNVLQDSSSGGAGGGGGVSPSFDLSKIGDTATADKLKNFWKDIIDFWENDWADFFDNVDGNWSMFIQGLGLTFKGFYDVFKGIIEVIIGIWDILVGLFTSDSEKIKQGWEKLWNGAKDIVKGIIEIIVGILMTALGVVKGLFLDIVDFIRERIVKPIGNFFGNLWDGIKTGVSNATNSIKERFNSIVDFFRGVKDRIVDLFRTTGTKVGEVVGGSFKVVVNGVLNAVENILNSPIRAINKLTDTINKVPGINLGRLSTFNLPRLRKGGIINMPGRGVAIGGESAREGVIPLTDSQQMELLGEAIGKYITVNANITNSMNGRVISRELQKIQNESNFAYNR